MTSDIVKVPFVSLAHMNNQVSDAVLRALKTVVESERYILGNEVLEFEKQYAKFQKVTYCIGTGNGLDALIIALRSVGIKQGDEVIVPTNTFIATALAVSNVGAKLVLVEPSEATYNIQSDNIRKAISNKTKAIIPVHLYGQACEMQSIMALADEFGLSVVEDNAQAQGASSGGKITGSFGQINATSFYPGKNLGAMGDAGAITTDNFELAQAARLLRNYGSTVKYIHEVQGQNSRLDEMQAAVLNQKLKFLNEWNQARQAIAKTYGQGLAGIGDIVLPVTANSVSHVFHLYVIRTDRRDALKNYLFEKGIETLIHYPTPIHNQLAYRELGHSVGSFPISEKLSNTSLSLPLYPGLEPEKQNYVINMVRKFYNEI